MAPRQNVVVENSALKRFMKKHGYCVSAAWIARLVEEEQREAQAQEGKAESIRCAGMRVAIKRRNGQWFVTDIEKAED